jgi:hypothetical protein
MSWLMPLHHHETPPVPGARGPLGLGRLPVSRRQRQMFWLRAVLVSALAAGLVTVLSRFAHGWT